MLKHLQGSMAVVAAITGGIFVVAFVALMVSGGYSFFPSVFLALLVALLSAIIVYLGFESGIGSTVTSTTKAKPAVATKIAAEPAPSPKTAASQKSAPVTSAPAPVAGGTDKKPTTMSAPKGGKADDLKKIKGVGPKLEKVLNGMGYYHYDQIAAWNASEIAWVDENLEGFKGRVTRDSWVAQAKKLAAG